MLKSMTGTKNFKELPNNQKKCAVHNIEECQTEKLFSQIKANCSCVPWSLTMNDNGKAQVFCGPEKSACVGSQNLRDRSCLVPCSGLYADTADGSLKQTMMEGFQSVTEELSKVGVVFGHGD